MFKKNTTVYWLIKNLGFRLLVLGLSAHAAQAADAVKKPADAVLTIRQAIEQAHRHDPWLAGNSFRQQSLESQSVAAATLPDPQISLAFANLPVDDFDAKREAMTQLKVNVAQQFPRGDSLALQQKQLTLLGSQHPLQRQDRRARVAVTVARLWLSAFSAQESIRLIEQDRELFEHLVDVAQSSYSSAMAKTRQQDLVRAQLELSRLEDRLTVLHERQETALSGLRQWLLPDVRESTQSRIQLAKTLPVIEIKHAELFQNPAPLNPQRLLPYLSAHPAIKSLDQKIHASSVEIELAKQKYKPQWGVNASYGYRDEDPTGSDRADFFSIGLTFDLPIFTSNRQDKEVQSAMAASEAVKTEKWLVLREFLAAFDTARVRLLRLNQRQWLYQSRLLAQMHEQAEASLTAYTNDDGDFSEVVRARIAELNAQIDALDINIERLKTIIQLNYFFTRSGDDSDRSLAGETS